MGDQVKEKVPMNEERLRISPEGKAYLTGMKCKSCGETIFPKAILCPNCCSEEVEEVILSTKGKIWSYTVIYQSYGDVIGLTPPYVTAFVELSGGAYVHAPIVGCDPEVVKIGKDVELDLTEVRKGEEKGAVTYVFKPTST
jgi:hypothetical protein